MTRRRLILLLVVAALAFVCLGYWNATRMPIVRRGTVWVNGWPADRPPLRVVLISDIHVAGPDMPPARVARIVDRINALQPDLVLIAGDLISARWLSTRRYSFDEAVAPLAAIRAPRLAVLGNHDHRRDADAARHALAKAHIELLDNRSVAFRGLTIVGVDDMYTGHPDPSLFARPLPQPVVLLTHSPQVVRQLPDGKRLVLAGHTHCGQVVLPVVGAVVGWRKGHRSVACGIIHRAGRDFVVSAGLGGSIFPIRYGAPPDIWLLTFRPTPEPVSGGRSPAKRSVSADDRRS